jgi:hypothetical protein
MNMLDLDERIRTYIETAQPQVTLDEVKTTVARHRLETAPRRVARPKRVLLGGAFVAAVVVTLIAVLIANVGTGQGGKKLKPVNLAMAPASKVLRTVAMVADGENPLVPGPGQYLYVRTLGASVVTDGAKLPSTGQEVYWTYYEQGVRQVWTSPAGPNATSTAVVGVPQFLTTADRTDWQDAGSPPISAAGGGNLPTPYYDVADLPTDPTKIAAYMASQPGLPAENLASSPVWQFDEASQYLGAGASAAQRAALYIFMSTLQGVVNYGTTTTLGTGLNGIAIGIPGRNGERVEAVIDPSSSTILELRTVVDDPAQYGALAGIWSVVAGEAEVYYDYVSTGIVDTTSASPTGAPALPAPWPFGTTQPPASSVAYPSL